MANNKIRIHFVLEGSEEETLLKILKDNTNSCNISFTYSNSHGGGNVPSYFQNALQSDNYDLVYCVYDVDYAHEQKDSMYSKIVRGLTRVLGSEKEVSNVSLCTNPNILLILLCGYTDNIAELEEISQYKSRNTDLFNNYCSIKTNKKEYDASDWQLEIIYNDYVYTKIASIDKIIDKINEIEYEYKTNKIGSNILPIIKAIYTNDVEYFNKIIEKGND